jgi:glucose/mannose transport system substrate-binding protein
MQWVLANGTDAHESKLMPLDDLVPDAKVWRRTMPAPLLERVSYDGKIYGVPANLHRNNSVFYSKRVFEKYGLSEPKSIDDLFAMGNKLRGSGVSLLALGSREPWTVSLFLFEGLLVAREGADVYRDYFSGRLAPDDPRIVRTLEAGLRLFAFANPDHKTLTWLQAVELVAQGKAAMTVMGDWARGPFEAGGLKLGTDYGQIPFPDAGGTFVFSADAFALPVGAKNRSGSERFLSTIGSPEGQRVISLQRGTLAARVDVRPPESDPVRVGNFALLEKGALVVALSGMVPAAFNEDLNAALSEMIDQHDADPVVHTLRSRYALLK